MTTDLRPLYRRALDAVPPLLDGLDDADLRRPTPCQGWDLAALLSHAIGQNHGFALAAERSDAPPEAYEGPGVDAATVGALWHESADRLAAAFAAAPLDRPVRLVEIAREPRFPVATAVGFQLLDTVVHTWDIAAGRGREHVPDEELAAATLAQARLVPQGASRTEPGAAFAPALPADALDDWHTALALLGRA
jgi:uncharacterized protein (TIGR03086 family)